jgi:hypothetical protein
MFKIQKITKHTGSGISYCYFVSYQTLNIIHITLNSESKFTEKTCVSRK